MREIKFRCWDSLNKRFLTRKQYLVHPIGVEYIAINMEPILMQYTGSKDKNGKEIYEGDILKIWSDSFCISSTFFSYFVQIKFGDYDNDEMYGDDIYGRGFYMHFNSGPLLIRQFHVNGKDEEIIGNIYENPELLEKWEK